jgi:hypothetical protein
MVWVGVCAPVRYRFYLGKERGKMTISTKWIRICNIACAVLLLALLALQTFQPFWNLPGCTCTTECTKAQNLMDSDKIDMNCPACAPFASIKVKACVWCKERPKTTELDAKEVANRDTAKDWTLSIQHYTWMPTFPSTKGVTDYFTSMYKDRSINNSEFVSGVTGTGYSFMVKDFVLMPVIVFFFGLIGGYLGIAKSKNPVVSIFALVTGIWVVKDYLTLHIFRIGNLWQLHMGIGIAIILFALVPTAAYLLRIIKWCNPKAAE